MARKRGKSLNGLIRDYLQSVSGEEDREEVAQAFISNARYTSGESDTNFRFSREEARQR
ncbi:MAG: hypothetical protein ACPGN3_17740 [Opitutales bacterium]